MELDKVHLFGTSLGKDVIARYPCSNNIILQMKYVIVHFMFTGGFLAQKFTEINAHCPRVVSLVLCNTFTDTSIFSYNDSATV